MQIVIDIPKEVHNIVTEEGTIYGGGFAWLMKSVANGVVLPEEHGRLIDADKLSKDKYLERRYGTDFYWEFRRMVDKQPTIIEADKEV